jgi:hypothetical protein
MPETGTFLSVDPVESEPPYVYVGGNPINRVDSSGYQANGNVCDGWSFPFKEDCKAMESGNLLLTETFYRTTAIWTYLRGMKGFYVSADLLDHYLNGTTTPAEPYYIYDREWILSTREDKNARKTLVSYFVDEYIKPAIDSCFSGPPIEEHLRTGNEPKDTIDPPSNTDVKNAYGNHYLHGYFEAQIFNDSNTVADISVKFMVKDYYDFEAADEKGSIKGISVNSYGIGFVPHQWLINLKQAQWAAEFDYYTLWTEHLTVDKTYKVRRVPGYGVPGWPTKPPTPEDGRGAILVKCQDCKSGK